MNLNFFTALLIVLIIAAATATLASATRTVEFVQLLHRHGARSPVLDDNTPEQEEFLCGGVGRCGQLNIQGEMMLQSLGKFLRQRYVDDSVLTDVPSPVRNPPAQYVRDRLQSGVYDTLKVHSQSTDIDRTLQSSGAMLRGLFPNTTGAMPHVIHTVSIEGPYARVLIPDLSVAYSFPTQLHMWEPYATWVFDVPVSSAVLVDVGIETKMQTVCSAAKLPTNNDTATWTPVEKLMYLNCALHLQDTASCFESSGMLGLFPKLQAVKAKLDPVREGYFYRTFQFLPDNNEVNKNAGQPMVPWGDTLFFPWAEKKIGEVVKLGRVDLEVLREYSAHDTSIAPLWSYLQHQVDTDQATDYFMRPQFGEVAIIEFIGDTVANDIFIQLWSGRPASMVPPPNNSTDPAVFYAHYNYSKTMKPVSVPCMSATDSSPRMVTDASCKYSDFKRAIQTKAAPQSSQGLCFIQSTLRTYIGCDTLDAPSADGACASYRQLCPKWGCPSGYVVNPADYSCVKLNSNSDNGSTTTIAPTVTSNGGQGGSSTSTMQPSVATSTTAPDDNNGKNNNSAAADEQYTKKEVVEVGAGAGVGGLLLGVILGACIASTLARRRIVHADGGIDTEQLASGQTQHAVY